MSCMVLRVAKARQRVGAKQAGEETNRFGRRRGAENPSAETGQHGEIPTGWAEEVLIASGAVAMGSGEWGKGILGKGMEAKE